jgi:hypothetical protein
MIPEPAYVAPDRTFLVPEGAVAKTGYVAMELIDRGCLDRMAVGDVDAAYRRLLQVAPAQPFPPPYGYWQRPRFVLMDGRHTYVAALMLGWTHMLVAWLERDLPPGNGADVFLRGQR